jgi:hypothetical protein
MDDDEKRDEKRLDLNDESGMTRRDMLRRGAIVGGTLLWVAPAIQSMAPRAFAQTDGELPGSVPQCAACYCWNGNKQSPTSNRGFDGDLGSGSGLDSISDCQNFCAHTGAYAGGGGAPGGPYAGSEFCSGTTCDTNTQVETGTNGAFCT